MVTLEEKKPCKLKENLSLSNVPSLSAFHMIPPFLLIWESNPQKYNFILFWVVFYERKINNMMTTR